MGCMLVSDAMTTAVVTIPIGASLHDAAGRMLEYDVGSVVVERGGDPAGIVTVTDVLAAAHRTGESLSSIGVDRAMSHPLVTVPPDATIRAAVDRMAEEHVKRLAVLEGLELVGILSQSDVVRNHATLLREAVHDQERVRWDGEEG